MPVMHRRGEKKFLVCVPKKKKKNFRESSVRQNYDCIASFLPNLPKTKRGDAKLQKLCS